MGGPGPGAQIHVSDRKHYPQLIIAKCSYLQR